ncbi:MAG: MFS transporter [Herminiimonas sp.]|nr:MFS transporter [Herminiimonas sp.]
MRLSALLAYGLFGLPLALVALPIYVYVPQFYAERFGLSLTMIGTALLLARVFDAFIDPAFGLWIDRSNGRLGYPRFILLALPPLVIGFIALFHPPAVVAGQPFAWFLASLLLVYVGFSLAMIAHQSWGAALTQARGERARLTATREGCGLLGVVIAAALPSVAGIGWLSAVFVAMLVMAAALLLAAAPRPASTVLADVSPTGGQATLARLKEPFRNRRFRWLFAVFVVNGIAAAIPATLFLFFAKDGLQLERYAGLFLVLYFSAAAVSLPLWVALARRRGEASAWLISMLLAIAAFIWVYDLPAGAAIGFGAVCVMSGFALGADLALPPALLAAVIARAGHSGAREGAYFGAWSWATKMNLALAAGVALPLLEHLGYVPGTVDADGTQALRVAYALLPCALKLLSASLLWRAPLDDL